MDNKRIKLVYWISTGILTLIMGVGSAGMYIVKHQMVSEIFEFLGYPTYIIYPLAIAKILGLIAIWTRKSHVLKEWAYAGFFFDLILAISAHLMVNDGEYIAAVFALVLLFISYFSEKKLNANKEPLAP